MNVYDIAHQLARALCATPEYKEFKKNVENLQKDSSAKEMLSDFRSRQLEIQALKLSGKPIDEELKKLENLYNIISCNTLLKSYLEAEMRFATIFEDVQKIIGDAIEPKIDKEKQ
ncbi:MAG TPA: hypothetical protein GX534_05935 [Thermoanaerobacterales bacterium]|jgi:cell fate (sporulation/competence/biofilm development) regulator YlbF (YheA/YmcA/DUF963 family)|nr:hypothetical protein [Thermoanaerobacterales bacterium]